MTETPKPTVPTFSTGKAVVPKAPLAPAAPSPEEVLAQARPESLDELFSRDPETLSDADLDRIVAEERTQRARFMEAEKAGKTTKNSFKVAAPKGLSLKDLGL